VIWALEPLLSDRAAARWLRRALSISGVAVALGVALLGLPLWVLLAAVADLLRALGDRVPPRWGALRTLALVVVLLLCEVIGVGAALVMWVGSGFGRQQARLHDWSFAFQCWWLGTLARAGLKCYRMRLEVEGENEVPPGPILIFLRHASTGDTVLASLLVSARHRIVLRYVLKRELLLDPCLDIVGNRLRNHFVRRGGTWGRPAGGDTDHEIEAVARLAEDLGPHEGVLLYPEGTRFTEARRRRVLERLQREGRGAEAERARSLRHVLPPRHGGALALLSTNERNEPPADVLFCSHAGLDGSASLLDLLRGDIVGRTLHVRFWRVPWSEVPAGENQRADWLDQQWRAVDRYVHEHLPRAAAATMS